MENKNLNDIVIEDNDNSKKTQLKNILTLLALLFIILVISIVITKLILGSDEDNIDGQHIKADGTVEQVSDTEKNGSDSSLLGTAAATTAALATTAATATVAAGDKVTDGVKSAASTVTTPVLTERNSTSRTKEPLRDRTTTSTAPKSSGTKSTSSAPKSSTYNRPKYVVSDDAKKESKSKDSTPKVASASRGYYIKVGAFEDATTAVKKIKAIKLNYRTIKNKEGLTRVLIGPFYSQKDAQNHLAKAKASVAKDAYITKIK
ncbi:MAG: SPOR domain-containing protein [Epsilonproteobacteria bacterium]|nr:SPOR domain-containing protein [Campylobacterota bacterium]